MSVMYKIFFYLCFTLLSISALPQYRLDAFRPRRSPQRAVMFGSYYSRPIKRNTEYIPIPEGGMTAFAAGDTVATNSYVGGGLGPAPEPNLIEGELLEVEESAASPQQELLQPSFAEVTTVSPFEVTEAAAEEVVQPEETEATTLRVSTNNNNNNGAPNKKKQNTTSAIPSSEEKGEKEEDDDEDEQSALWPFLVGSSSRRARPIYNAFFPVILGGYGGARSRTRADVTAAVGDELPVPGSATAIANSFSTGKGGVASSHATSYGDPYLSTLLRNGFGFKKNKIPQGGEY